MQNLSCENEFYLHDYKKSFTQETFCTCPRFTTEAFGISEMAYSVSHVSDKNLVLRKAVRVSRVFYSSGFLFHMTLIFVLLLCFAAHL